MKKEIVVAILIGLVMGLFITYGVYYAQQSKNIDPEATVANLDQQPVETTVTNGKLAIHSPEDEIITTEQTIKVAGHTSPNTHIVIFNNNSPVLSQADETGNFAKEISLEPLANIITVHSIAEDGEVNSVTRTVVVYDQELTLQEQQEGLEESEEESETETSETTED